MKPFEKRQPERQKENQSIPYALISRIEQSKRQLAMFLGTQSEKLSIKQKKIALLVFGVLILCICAGLIIRPFITDGINRFSIPTAIKPSALGSPSSQEDSLIDQSSYNSLVRIKGIIDSLKYSDGRGRYNQLMRERPGLVDSLNILLHEH